MNNQPGTQSKTPICDKFLGFHKENPGVYELFKVFTFQAIVRGYKHLSADMVGHRIRWETKVETTNQGFKINNDYIAWYSRLFEADYPEHKGFFRKRKVRG